MAINNRSSYSAASITQTLRLLSAFKNPIFATYEAYKGERCLGSSQEIRWKFSGETPRVFHGCGGKDMSVMALMRVAR